MKSAFEQGGDSYKILLVRMCPVSNKALFDRQNVCFIIISHLFIIPFGLNILNIKLKLQKYLRALSLNKSSEVNS